MKTYRIDMVPRRTVGKTMLLEASTPLGAVRAAERKEPALRAVGVEDQDEAGDFASDIEHCESCGDPVLTEGGEGAYAYEPEDGLYFCTECAADLRAEEPTP